MYVKGRDASLELLVKQSHVLNYIIIITVYQKLLPARIISYA